MDDRFVHDPIGYVVVASLDLRMAGVWLRDTISGLERTTRRSVSCYISGRYPHELRNLWKFVVCLQSERNGLVRTPDSFAPRVYFKMELQYMVWGANKHRRDVCLGDATCYVA